MQTYVSLRINKGRKRLTVYLAPELFTIERAELPMARPSVYSGSGRPAARIELMAS